jgi:hypothetical protein
LTLTDGRIYSGDLENGLPHGQGTMTFPSGMKFVGQFENGKFIEKRD